MDVGMSSFTLPQLIDWWNFRSNGVYVNRAFFPEQNFGLGDLIDPITTIEVSNDAFDPPQINTYDIRTLNSYSFNAWRFEKYNAGNYKNYSVLPGTDIDSIRTAYRVESEEPVSWEYYNNHPDVSIQDSDPYNWENLDIRSYTDKEFDRTSKTLIDFPELKRKKEIISGGQSLTTFDGVMPVNLIAMNDYYNILGYSDNPKDNATKKFLQDIRRSKNASYISWSGVVPLFLNVFEGGQKCVSDENFVFKLYLFDKKKPLDYSKSQVFPSITLGTHAIGPDGTNQKGKVDGDSFAITDGAPDKKVGGKLKTSYRSYDGTFSAGSEQIYGVVVSESIPAASFADDMLDWAENMDIEEHFKDAVTNQHLTPGSGLVITIDMQNSNPFQWAPNYANPKGCRDDNKEKVSVNVFNMSTRQFTKGETVLLTDRYSLWFIDPVAEGAEPALPLKKTVSKWQFTYHITNQDFFYRFADPTEENNVIDGGQHLNPKVINCMDAEQALSRKYLAARNASSYDLKYGPNSSNTDSDFIEERDAGKAWPGYAQVTSWDFMGTHLAGLREERDGTNLGNALVLTTTSKNHRGEFLQEFNNDGVLGVGRFTAPFFGCAFPDGYLGGDETDKYADLNAAVKEGDNFTGKGFYVSGQDIRVDEAFFNQDSFAVDDASNTGILDPTNTFNNISTNISPLYFFKELYDAQEVADEPHVNIFSSEERLFHLPADMGVNGSFNAEYGGPILNLNKVQNYLTSPIESNWSNPTSVYNNFHDFWQDPASFQWLYNIVDSETKQETNDPDNSTFDIRPKNPNRVEFRPLRDSVFAQFDPPQVNLENMVAGVCDSGFAITNIPYPAKRLVEQGFNNYPTVADGTITPSAINISNYGGNKPLWGWKTKERLLVTSEEGGLILAKNAESAPITECAPDQVKTEQLNSNITDVAFTAADGFPYGKIMPFKYNPWYLADDKLHLEWDKLNLGAWYQILENLYPNYVPDNHYGARPNSLSRGAYGVIGAVCTCEMEAGVQVKTENVLGQRHKPINNVFYPSWGARQDLSYNDPNNTALFVKVYEAWPREQTIFDSRFFAVHHFNEGNNLKVEDGKRPWEADYEFGVDINYGEKDVDDNLIREDENPLYSFTYSSGTQQVSDVNVQYFIVNDGENQALPVSGIPVIHDKIVTNVDHKIPSIFSRRSVNLFIEEGETPDLDSFEIEPLLNSEQVANDKLVKSSLIFSEGIAIDGRTSDYIVDADVIKNIDVYVEEEFGEDENFDLAKYRDKYKKYTPLVSQSLWDVDSNRRARLLPWIYRKHDLSLGYSKPGNLLGEPSFIDFTDVEEEDTLHDILKEQEGKNIIVADKGTGYSVGNIFTVTGGSGSSVRMRVSAIGDEGSVEALEWIFEEETVVGTQVNRPLWGYGFLPEDFLAGETTNITSETISNIRISPVGNINTSFKAYFVAGYTSYEEFIDRKPQVVTEFKDAYKVSAPNNKNGESGKVTWRDSEDVQIIPLGAQALVLGDGTAFVATPGGLENTDHVVGTNTRNLNLNYDTDKSNPNVLKGVFPKFDLFFHFHCDVTHQWIATQDTPIALENLVDMELFPF